MNILFIIVIAIVAIIVLVLVLALIAPKSYSIQREIRINKPINEVYEYVKLIKNQDHYSVWVQKDPHMKKEYKGTDGTVGFLYSWDGNKKVGAGSQEIKNLEQGKKIDLEIRFIRPFKAIASTPFFFESEAENQTKVIWGMNSTMNYPMNVMLLMMNMDKLLGKELEISLEQLKKAIEK